MADEKQPSKWVKLLSGKKWLLVLLAVALLFLVLGGEHTAKTDTDEGAADIHARTEAYRKTLESELGALCTQLAGVDEVSVMITLDGTERAVYAADSRGEGKSDYVVSGGEGLLLGREYPAIVGVAIVCRGASAAACDEVARLASATLGIGLNRIYVGVG